MGLALARPHTAQLSTAGSQRGSEPSQVVHPYTSRFKRLSHSPSHGPAALGPAVASMSSPGPLQGGCQALALYRDFRLGGMERLFVGGEPRDYRVRIPDDLLQCVCFVAVNEATPDGERMKYAGTAFFVSVPSAVAPDSGFIYLVTARHCVRRAENAGGLFVRLNTKAGGSELVRVTGGWQYPDDLASDVAVLGWAPPGPFAYKHVPRSMLAGHATIPETGIGVGDEVVVVGLFTRRHGLARNLPIVRTGIIAAMPEEPFRDKYTGLNFPAYIAEVRSIGGLSGSPVFAVLGPARLDPKTTQIRLSLSFHLLGLIRGHWDHKLDDPEIAFSSDEQSAVNMGMALVTPAQDIIEVLDAEYFTSQRAARDAERLKDQAVTDDHAGRTSAAS